MSEWNVLLNSQRRKSGNKKNISEFRTEVERDYDRILFSAPVRRLADKTQVFPLDKNDSIRNRLTHSHEVSNLARSIGLQVAVELADKNEKTLRDLPALLAAVGLVHDLGNPPFGHQGEAAIRRWFENNRSKINLCDEYFQDFTNFDGNAQTLRLVTKLQLLNDGFGLDLTFATLASLMKYTVSVGGKKKDNACTKKHGYFLAEKNIASEVLRGTGLDTGKRHICAYIMEACDDIAYATIDVEDCVKKGLISINDVISIMKDTDGDDIVSRIVEGVEKKRKDYKLENLSPSEFGDLLTQRWRVFVIGEFVNAIMKVIKSELPQLMAGEMSKPLIESSDAAGLESLLKDITSRYAFKNRSVLELELTGHNTITRLMDMLWPAIDCADHTGVKKTAHPFYKYAYSRISDNYRRVFESPPESDKNLAIEYRRCLLLTDMISGMTDSYALSLLDEFERHLPKDLMS